MSDTSKPERDINIIINRLLITIKTHEQLTIPIMWAFRNLQSSICYMAPELTETGMHWVQLVNILNGFFPITTENKEKPIIKEIQDIVQNQTTHDGKNEIQFQETDEEFAKLKEYTHYKMYFVNLN